MVVDTNGHSLGDGRLANETSQEILRSQETRLERRKLIVLSVYFGFLSRVFFPFFFFSKIDFTIAKNMK